MKVRYVTTKGDVIRGSLSSVFFNRALRLYTILLIAVVMGLSVSEDLEAGRSAGFIAFSVAFQIVCIFLLLMVGLLLVTGLNLFLSNGRGVLGEHELALSEQGLTEKTEVNERLHKWSGLGEVRATSSYYFLRVNEIGGGYHLLPRRRAALEGDVEAFVAEFRARTQRA